MSVSIYDIAKKANVAPSTVSRALQDHPRIGKATKNRIRKLARDMGYVPSAVARSLTSRQTHTIGMVVLTLSDHFTGEMVEGVERIAAQEGYRLFLSVAGSDLERELEIIKAYEEQRVDGLIFATAHPIDRYLTLMARTPLPVVLINEQQHSDRLITITIDNLASASVAVEHLIDLGHRRIGYVGFSDRSASNPFRMEGYRNALAKHGIAVASEWVYLSAYGGEGYLQRGLRSLDKLLRHDITAIFCHDDMVAIGVLSACTRLGIHVPQDVSVVGFDDIEMAQYTFPPLTTIHQPRSLLGERAVNMIVQLIAGKEQSSDRQVGDLIVRDSTAPPARVSGEVGSSREWGPQ